METILFFEKMKITIRFKSYYVVWKPAHISFDDPLCAKFKSHYVVWKLIYNIKNNKMVRSLNRTMQYGNGRLSGEELKKLLV